MLNTLALTDDEAKHYTNELNSLNYLAQGLGVLYSQTKKLEDQVSRSIASGTNTFIFGNHPVLQDVPMGLVACFFHWYAVSICNYVKMVGWLGTHGNHENTNQYLTDVLPSVKKWRDKVGAHFAVVSPREDDSPADLASSVMFPISFFAGNFQTAVLRISMTRKGKGSTSRDDMQWSLTKVHEALSERYWLKQG